MRLLTAREILFDYLDDLLDTKDKRTVVALGKYLSKICKAEGISHVNSYTGNPNLYHVASVEKARQWIANGDVKFINEYLNKNQLQYPKIRLLTLPARQPLLKRYSV